MMKMYVLIALLFPFIGRSQLWTLDQCIDTALNRNLLIQQKQIENGIATYNLKAAKTNLLPALNANATHGYNWGQTIDLFTNQFATNRVMFDNFYLNSSVILFSGLQNYYNIKLNNLSVQEIGVDRLITERNVKIDVSSAFLQVLLNKDVVELAKENIEKSTVHLQRTQELLNAKQATQAELLEIEAQVELDRYFRTKAESDLRYSKLLLQQLLNLQTSDSFDVADSFLDLPALSSADDASIEMLPELLKIEIGAQKQLFLLKSAKGRFYPTLNLSGSLGSGYSQNNKVINSNGDYVARPFGEQINNNLYQSVMVSLSIPIFNKNANRTQVKIKELELQSLLIEKQNEYNRLKQTIEQLTLDISNASNQIEALEKVRQSASLNYGNFLIRYENGDVSFTQLMENRNKLIVAESELLQANYQLLLKQVVLGFYFP